MVYIPTTLSALDRVLSTPLSPSFPLFPRFPVPEITPEGSSSNFKVNRFQPSLLAIRIISILDGRHGDV